jgi:hypothetical protein
MKVLQGELTIGGYVQLDRFGRRWQQPVTIDLSPETGYVSFVLSGRGACAEFWAH